MRSKWCGRSGAVEVARSEPLGRRAAEPRAAQSGSTGGARGESFGHTDVIDLGDTTTARGAEMYLPIWLRLMCSLGTPIFNARIVR